MPDDTVISVENLSKRYLVGHEAPQERYQSMRDNLVRHGKNFARKALDMARGRQIIQGDSVEDFWALKDVSFEVKRGEVLGIIGRNGAGKSTLLKVLSRITEPTEGRVTLNGRVASLLEVGTGFHPELSGRENIFLNGAILGMTRAEIRAKFDEIVDFASVEKFLDTPVKRYSSGMYVRLAFAVAAHLEPEILIVDEVLAVGDAEFQKKCLGKMQDVAKGGRTVLFVSHQLDAVERLCNGAILLELGLVKETGNAAAIIRNYRRENAEPVSEVVSGKHFEGVSLEENQIPFGGPFELHVMVRPDEEVIGVNVGVFDDHGEIVFLCSTNPHDGFSIPTGDSKELVFSVPELFLSPGSYTLHIQITEPGIRIIEEFERCCSFEVTERRIGGAWGYDRRFGRLYPPHGWSLK